MDEQHKGYGVPDEVIENKFFDVPTTEEEPNDNTKMVM
jgi:hypothetical protein